MGRRSWETQSPCPGLHPSYTPRNFNSLVMSPLGLRLSVLREDFIDEVGLGVKLKEKADIPTFIKPQALDLFLPVSGIPFLLSNTRTISKILYYFCFKKPSSHSFICHKQCQSVIWDGQAESTDTGGGCRRAICVRY